jgi:hypothetical protein
MIGFRKIFPIFLSHYATFFAKMAERKVVPFDEFYYQLKLMHLFQKHPVQYNRVSHRVWYIFKPVVGPQVKVFKQNFSVLSLIMRAQEQFENVAKTV